MAFIDFDICHRMVPLRMLYIVTLTYFSNINITQTAISSSKMRDMAFVDFDNCHKNKNFESGTT